MNDPIQTAAEALALARQTAATVLCREDWKPGVKNGIYHEIINGDHDNEPIVQIALAAIRATSERAAVFAESDALILSGSRRPGSFGWTRKNHGEIIAKALRANQHLAEGEG